MSSLENLQNLINQYNDEITKYNDEILVIDSEHPSHQDVTDYLLLRKNNLQNYIAFITQRRDLFQQMYDIENAKLNAVFTPEQQAVVDTIDPKYSSYMDNLKKMDSGAKNTFFSLYQNADNSVQKECIINNFFEIL